jgi:GT2 family glycosyltransferase
MVDIIILSFAKNNHLLQLTQQSIDTCLRSDPGIQFNILVLEQQPDVTYERATTHHITEPFNYNRFMNIGIGMTTGEYVCLCNNDLIFQPKWCSNMIAAMQSEFLLSASPLCPKTQGATFKHGPNVDYGYSNAKHLSGWCIFTDRFLYEIIGPIDEDFPFWFADNAYAEQLKKHKVKHALIRNAWVEHKGSRTLKGLDTATHDEYTTGLIKKFIAKYPNNESAIYFANQK